MTHITIARAKLEQWLKAIEMFAGEDRQKALYEAGKEMLQALAAPTVQEPCRDCLGEGIQGEEGDGFVSGVTWRCDSCNGTGKSTPPAQPAPVREPDRGDELTIAYMSGVHRGKELAAQRQWVGLTNEERVMCRSYDIDETIAKTEAKLKEKNT